MCIYTQSLSLIIQSRTMNHKPCLYALILDILSMRIDNSIIVFDFTWMFICHLKCISVKRYTSTSSFAVWRIHTKKKWPSWRQSTCKQFWTSSCDIDDELMILSTKHFHVKLLSQTRTIAFNTIYLEAFLSLVWQSAITWSIRWT